MTGVSGFLGRWVDAVAPGERFGPASSAMNLLDPASVQAAVRELRPTLVLHMAAMTDLAAAERAPELARAIHVDGTAALLRAVAAHAPRARVVHVSTCHVYGRPHQLPIAEDHPLEPRGVYARSKAEGEGMAQKLARELGIDLVIVRPFNLVGPGQPRQHAVADWILQSLAGARALRVGDLSVRRDYLDVRDCAEGIRSVAERAASGATVNLCSGRAVAMASLAELAAPGCAWLEDPARARPGEVRILLGDNGRARALGWAPRRALAQSVDDLRAALATGPRAG